MAPFIFYGNIKDEINSDLIGEIKESVSTGDKKHISQLNKYRKIVKLSESDLKISKKFGLKPNNQKILVYIFNSNYKEYLKRMLLSDTLNKKFKELNDSSKAKNLCELFSKTYKNDEKKIGHDFIKEVVNSDNPYIFIFIQDLVTLLSKIKSKEKEKKDDKINNENEINTNKDNQIKKEEKKEDKFEEKKESGGGEEKEKDKTANDIKEIKYILLIFMIIQIFLSIVTLFNIKK